MLVASLAVSCGSNDSRGATVNQQSTIIAPTTVPATTATPTAAGQTVRGTGYSLSLPAGWFDVTEEQRKAFSLKFDLALGSGTKGAGSNLIVTVQPSRGLTLAGEVGEGRKEVVQALGARLVGQVERLSLAGIPAMAFEYTYRLGGGPLHAREVVCLRGGKLYVLAFGAHSQAFTASRAAFDEILASWSWG